MEETSFRMIEAGHAPDAAQVEAWVGAEAYRLWTALENSIERNYPQVFSPEWLYGGKKHGWTRRYKKSKSFCTFVPEKDRFALLIVFGTDERERVETIRAELSDPVLKVYDAAQTYHDGKWVLFNVNSAEILGDIERLLCLKRRPRGIKMAV